MSTPDYPLLTVPGYELYHLAHLTTFVVDALARHRRAVEAGDRQGRRVAAAAEIPTGANADRPHGSLQPPVGSSPLRPPPLCLTGTCSPAGWGYCYFPVCFGWAMKNSYMASLASGPSGSVKMLPGVPPDQACLIPATL